MSQQGSGRNGGGAGATELADALSALAEEAAALADAPGPRCALAATVLELEAALGAPLGPVMGDPLVVLQRRWARLHRLAGAAGPGLVQPGRVRVLAATLRAAAPEPAGRAAGRGPLRRLRTSPAGW